MMGLVDVPQQTPRETTDAPPSLVTAPPDIAVVVVIPVTSVVSTVGNAGLSFLHD